jgi:hypothetical protein
MPLLARALQSDTAAGFTRDRLARLLREFRDDLTKAAKQTDVVDAFFSLLKDPLENRGAVSAALHRVALAYLTHCRNGDDRPYDPVANFHFSNGARLESINPFANVRPYGLRDSFGVMVNYRYVPNELEENHERFVQTGELRVSGSLLHDYKTVSTLWAGEPAGSRKRSTSATTPVASADKPARQVN